MSILGPARTLVTLTAQAVEAVSLMVRAPHAATDQLWADTTRQAQQAAALERIVCILEDIRNTLVHNTSPAPARYRGFGYGAADTTPAQIGLGLAGLDDAFPLYQCGNPNCRCDEDPNYLPRPDSSAAPGAHPDAAADAPRRASPYGAGHPNDRTK